MSVSRLLGGLGEMLSGLGGVLQRLASTLPDVGVVGGSGNVVIETRLVSGFKQLDVSGIGEVTVTQGDVESLEVEAEDNIMPYIETEVRGDTLVLGLRSSTQQPCPKPTKPVKFQLQVREVVGLSVSGSASVASPSLSVPELSIDISGAASVDVQHIRTERLRSAISGCGSVSLAGEADTQELKISGAGSLAARDLVSRVCHVEVSGTGSAVVHASETLKLDVSGVASVSYAGDPSVTKRVDGMASIERVS